MVQQKASKLRIIVTGLIAQHPHLGGVAWDYVQYVVGLKGLGHDVYYFEDSGQWPYRIDGGPTGSDWIARDCRSNVTHLKRVMERYGLEDRWAYQCPVESRWYGLSSAKRREIISSADLLFNVSGSLRRPRDYRSIPRLVYIDSDPVFTQVKLKLGRGQERFKKRMALHDVFFSFGERLSKRVPSTDYDWRPTRQPIVLSEWRPSTQTRKVFTTVMSWASYKPLTYEGIKYGQKDVEFRRFIDLPKRVGVGLLEVAMGDTRHVNWETSQVLWPESTLAAIREHPDQTPKCLLRASGWGVVEATDVGADLDTYRRYIESSRGEWSVAKNGYVVAQSGWFSCRSACYLAAGKPVVVQETGFSQVLDVGEGVLPFESADDAVDAIETVQRDYNTHSEAARGMAEAYFDARRVLSELIDSAMYC